MNIATLVDWMLACKTHRAEPCVHSRVSVMVAVLTICFLASGCSKPPAPADSWEVQGPFEVRLAASEPQIVDPVALAFDEHERMYVVELAGYPEGTDPPRSRIKILEDRDGDGRYETSHIFLDGLQYPTSVLPWKGGVLVAHPPDLMFCQDTNGDFVADKKEVLFTGFDVGNTQHNYNSLFWGLDGWVYGAGGGNAGMVTSPRRPAAPVAIRRRDFRLRPETGEIETTASSAGGYGLTMDNWGHQFTTHNMLHVQHVVLPLRYLARNPALRATSSVEEISDHERVSAIFPISKPETRVNHPEQAGHFSGSSGITFYGGGAFPDGYNDSLFVGDVVTNLVHRDVLKPRGATFAAARGEQNVEFLASRDNWVRPVNMANGPDGALYVLDMHRAVIEHPEWIPDVVEKKLDVRAGEDKGRIYRVLPKAGLAEPGAKLAGASTAQLVAALEHPNQWRRQTAQRLLVERNDPTARPALGSLLVNSKNPLGRLHALWTLQNLGALADDQLLVGLGDATSGVRENAARICESRAATSPPISARLVAMAEDPDPLVRFQVALSLGEIPAANGAALLSIGLRDVEDRWTRLAVVSSAGDRDADFLKSFLSGEPTEGRRAMVRLLGSTIGARSAAVGVVAALRELNAPALAESFRVAGLEGLGEGLGRAAAGRKSGAEAQALVRSILASASTAVLRSAWPVAAALGVRDTPAQKQALAAAAVRALDMSLPTEARLEEIRLLEFSDYKTHGPTALRLAQTEQLSELQAAAVALVGKWSSREGVAELLTRWRHMSPAARKRLVGVILRNLDFHLLLIEALERKEIRFGELALDLEQRRDLLRDSSEQVKERAARLFGDEEYSNRRKLVDQYMDVLTMQGDARAGERVFRDSCMKCHSMQSEGARVGPDLSHIYTKSSETILTEILDPNAVVEDRYITYTLKKKNGTVASGLIKEETTSAVVLTSGDEDEEEVNRADIASLSATGISLMPEGFEQTLDRRKLADLISFLQRRPGGK